MQQTVTEVTARIQSRSRDSREAYLTRMRELGDNSPFRDTLSCGNLAHGFASAPKTDKSVIRGIKKANLAVVSAYNDMLSAHQPLGAFPELIKQAAREAGCTAQFAGGVPAMCDGVTQGQPGMELSLFSRDTIAMATAISLSHNMFDAALCLGICDKIVPGLLIGSLSFGYLPVIFVPGGPMPSGLPNTEKSRIRNDFAAGKIGREELLEAEASSYHGPGTCTFYGTANSNQMLMEVMGLHLPGSAFINPNTPLRNALVREAALCATRQTALGGDYIPLMQVLDEKAIVNGMVGLLATGGSTNHTIHLVAIARAAGIQIDWEDFSDLSGSVPLLTRIYPNGEADINQFHAAGGMAFLIRQLLDAGLLHEQVHTVAGTGLRAYQQEPFLDNGNLVWREGASESLDTTILRPVNDPFSKEGGLRLLQGNLGRSMIKISAVEPEHRIVEAPAVVFHSQEEFETAFRNDALNRDCIVVLRYQGPRANGMPESHKLTPYLSVLQDRGYKVGLVTDGRMSGASGRVPAAIHVIPEAANGGMIAKIMEGDTILLDAEHGRLEVRLDDVELSNRPLQAVDLSGNELGLGRELFAHMRRGASDAEHGATVFGSWGSDQRDHH